MTIDQTVEVEALVIGSGPGGATIARGLSDAGIQVTVLETGGQFTPRIGEHLANDWTLQRSPDSFVPIVRGLLHPVSADGTAAASSAVDPIAESFERPSENGVGRRNELTAAATFQAAGGGLIHWTRNTPRPHPMELASFLDPVEADRLYSIAESLLRTRTDVYAGSVRHAAIKRALAEHYRGRLSGSFPVQELPVASERQSPVTGLIRYSGVDTILGDLADRATHAARRFEFRAQHRVIKLEHSGGRVTGAIAQDLMNGKIIRFVAHNYVAAGGAIFTPQLLWVSGIRPGALGRYVTDHTLTFTQVMLSKQVLDSIRAMSSAFMQTANQGRESSAAEQVPIPQDDLPPMIWIPVQKDRPWHSQIHKDTFAYGELPRGVDNRTIVDLRWFGMIEPRPDNMLFFDERRLNKFGMPTPQFDVALSEDDARRAHDMMRDMTNAALAIGGFLPGSEPRFMPLGSALHVQGTTRLGATDDGTSVADEFGRVWGFSNLFVAGNGVIPTMNAANPTLTTVALAVRTVENIVRHQFDGSHAYCDSTYSRWS